MNESKLKGKIFLTLVILLLFIYSVCRACYIFFNRSDLEIDAIQTLVTVLIHGIRFDISAIFLINAIFLLILWMPARLLMLNGLISIYKTLFLSVNIFFILINCIDIVYFPFVQKRMQSDAFLFVTGEKGNELFGLLPTFIKDYFLIWVLFGLLSYLFYKISVRQICKINNIKKGTNLSLSYFIFPLVSLSVLIIGARGGWQLRPIAVIQASDAAGVINSSAVLNTTFSVIQTLDKGTLKEMNYFPDQAFSKCELGVHNMSVSDNLTRKPNIVIIMVESLSKSYLKYFGGTVETPFLDSLMDESLVFSNAFANARESVQGVPAVLSSVPAMMNEAFIFSRYSTNRINSLASVLKNSEYYSAFFHAGTTGTMGFSSFCALTGFDQYYGRENYPDKDDFDGSWGIWDHKFFPFMATELTTLSQPFIAGILTMNPHSPFKLPDEFKDKFKSEGHPIKTMLQYEDYALSIFFEKAKKQPWFDNTIFVITADHTGPNIEKGNIMDDYRIPIVFFNPSGTFKGVSESVASQIDIMPTILNYVKAESPFFSMGRNLFSDECEGKSIVFHGGIYHFIDQKYYLQYNGEELVGVYQWGSDPNLMHNLVKEKNIESLIKDSSDKMLKAIQLYNNNMAKDRFIIR